MGLESRAGACSARVRRGIGGSRGQDVRRTSPDREVNIEILLSDVAKKKIERLARG